MPLSVGCEIEFLLPAPALVNRSLAELKLPSIPRVKLVADVELGDRLFTGLVVTPVTEMELESIIPLLIVWNCELLLPTLELDDKLLLGVALEAVGILELIVDAGLKERLFVGLVLELI